MTAAPNHPSPRRATPGRRGVSRSHRLASAAVAGAVLVLVVLGWREFYFLTDDAYIAFRYISNQNLGYGYVWNPPPFQPVEGYTSFLWVVLLDWTWAVSGLPPPQAAPLVSLVLGCATLALVGWTVLRMSLPDHLERLRLPFVALVLVATVTNRTFLAWLSSGLETALFNFCFTAWLCCMLRWQARLEAWWLALTATTATLAALTRPEGLLVVGGTLLALAPSLLQRRARISTWAAALPLLGVPMHLLWRKATYGAWLPNTYFAKVSEPWPESGRRYLACFIIEYSLWAWLLLAAAALLAVGTARRSEVWGHCARSYGTLVAVAVLLAHLGYFTLVVGGDHFEYRVFSHLIPLLFASSVWAISRIGLSRGWSVALLAAFIAASHPIPWSHYLGTRHLTQRDETYKLKHGVAQHFPGLVRPYLELFDAHQAWLIDRSVGLRHQEHKAFHQYRVSMLPSREAGQALGEGELLIRVATGVGVIGWVLPHVAILDSWGLNDAVVARSEPRHHRSGRHPRQMAHNRRPPPGYFECFRPNVVRVAAQRIVIRERPRRWTARRIVECERRWRRPQPSRSTAEVRQRRPPRVRRKVLRFDPDLGTWLASEPFLPSPAGSSHRLPGS